MDTLDDGTFHYNKLYYPSCIEMHFKCDSQVQKGVMRGIIKSYLKDSYRNGTKHHRNILQSGLDVSEAAVMHLANNECQSNVDVDRVLLEISLILLDEFDSNYNVDQLSSHLDLNMFSNNRYKRELLVNLKKLIPHTNKGPGHAIKLKRIKDRVEDIVSECQA